MSVIDDVKQRLDAVELIGRYVELRKAGTIYKGLCPFHSERTPSFVVYPDRGTWHCFGSCGTGGDISISSTPRSDVPVTTPSRRVPPVSMYQPSCASAWYCARYPAVCFRCVTMGLS